MIDYAALNCWDQASPPAMGAPLTWSLGPVRALPLPPAPTPTHDILCNIVNTCEHCPGVLTYDNH
jgi:hypothetical protein